MWLKTSHYLAQQTKPLNLLITFPLAYFWAPSVSLSWRRLICHPNDTSITRVVVGVMRMVLLFLVHPMCVTSSATIIQNAFSFPSITYIHFWHCSLCAMHLADIIPTPLVRETDDKNCLLQGWRLYHRCRDKIKCYRASHQEVIRAARKNIHELTALITNVYVRPKVVSKWLAAVPLLFILPRVELHPA